MAMTMDEAIEAGLLAQAYRTIPELIANCEGEATGPLKPKQRRWKALALEVWGKDHEDDSGQEHVGEVLLPPTFAVSALGLVKQAIAVRLGELGVVVE